MALKCGIVGLPNVGKSTLFNCLSSAKAQAANYPFCTIEPNVGVITVPDNRLNKLAELVNPEKMLPTTIEIVDIAGLVEGASKGEGLGNKFLANIRETDAVIHVIRCFDNDNITHVNGRIDPLKDKEIIETELQIKDLETLEKRIEVIKRKANSGDKIAKKELEVYDKYYTSLSKGILANMVEATEEEKEIIRPLSLLTFKSFLYVCNVNEKDLRKDNEYVSKVKKILEGSDSKLLVISAEIESDIAQLENYEDKQLFLEDLGIEETGVNKLIRKAYELLDLQTFFTAGKKEVRAWTIKNKSLAPQAAGVIHTDFEKGFIKAEVIGYQDFIAYKSENASKEAGKLRLEGKNYEVQDGDIMHFRFNN